MFSEKLEPQGWLDLFTDTKRGCSVPNLAEFYANCVVVNGVVTSTVNGHDVRFSTRELGKLLGVSSEGFDVYVREDKNVLGDGMYMRTKAYLMCVSKKKNPRSRK